MDLPIATASAFFLDLYARYRRDVGSVPADWRLHFEDLDAEDRAAERPVVEFARQLIDAYRRHGHIEARLDPLEMEYRPKASQLQSLRAEISAKPDGSARVRIGESYAPKTLTELELNLRGIYSGTSAIEAAHIEDESMREWLYREYEATIAAPVPAADIGHALESVVLADTFETFLKIKFPSKKRFGVEGAETMIVFLRDLLKNACASGFVETVMGGMHRGRLATLATVLNKPVGLLLAEIKGRDLTHGGPQFTGDVPYHLGYAGEVIHDGRRMKVSISPHPSHLMTVAPVVTGLARAKWTPEMDNVLCILLHTDAAFSGQGVTAELLQLGGLSGYTVGGTIHLVVNNQIGFTTSMSEGRSSRYCTDIGKATEIPILHVNGDDPVAVMQMARVALAWRRRTSKDILIDLVCYRRNGHNELDEPRFTQPMLSMAIERKKSLRETFTAKVASVHSDICASAEAAGAGFRSELQLGYESIEALRPNDLSADSTAWSHFCRAGVADMLSPVATGLPVETLRKVGRISSMIPASVDAHPKVALFYKRRFESIESGHGINFATAEALAFATLLADGVPVRLSGQDSVRGTFTQRHLAVHDIGTGATVVPLDGAAVGTARFEAVNSPLSEYAVLGFEYGHSLADPLRLTLWEAQFGDFLNGAQIIADQFIVSAEAKWQMISGLVVLLPHGLEGQGPDHSSARIERLLQLAAGNNIIVAHPTTPANLFHLLRRQIVAPWRKPLFVVAPKSLLRLKESVSDLAEMGDGTTFRPVIAERPEGLVRRIVMCSGKIFYDLAKARANLDAGNDVLLVRLEQLFPFPINDLTEILCNWPDADRVWCQEEPENQGGLSFVMERLRREKSTATDKVIVIARPPLPVAAGGSIERHEIEQRGLVARALDLSYRGGD